MFEHLSMEKEQIIERVSRIAGSEKLPNGTHLHKPKKKKKDKGKAKSNEKVFLDVWKTMNRNHYILNQMVDRKARILLSGNVVILSIIIGSNIVSYSGRIENGMLFVFLGAACFVSIIFSVIAILPEKHQGGLQVDEIRNKANNPLFFGNFKSLDLDVFEEEMMLKVDDPSFMFRSLIQDTYHIGQRLDRKHRYLRISLQVFVIGLGASLIFSYMTLMWNP